MGAGGLLPRLLTLIRRRSSALDLSFKDSNQPVKASNLCETNSQPVTLCSGVISLQTQQLCIRKTPRKAIPSASSQPRCHLPCASCRQWMDKARCEKMARSPRGFGSSILFEKGINLLAGEYEDDTIQMGGGGDLNGNCAYWL